MHIVETNLDFPKLRRRSLTVSIILHHTVSGNVSAREIHRWHSEMGGIGYHYLIRHGGTIERGRPEWAVGAHARGQNGSSIGVALTGNFERHRPSTQQISSLEWLVENIRGRHTHWKNLPIRRHSEVDRTACPGRHLTWRGNDLGN